MRNEQDHITDALIISYLNGDPLPEQSVEAIERWLEDDHNKLKAREVYKSWELSMMTAPATADVDGAFRRMQEKLKPFSAPKTTHERFKLFRWSVAAGILLFAGLAVWLLYFQNEAGQMQTYVAKDQKQEIRLVDGSIVSLNTNSRISFSGKAMGEGVVKREVHLVGEAFFEVSHDPERPFLVYTPDAQIEVLGTKFLVEAFEGSRTKVLVTEGRVQVTYTSSGEKFILKSNEEVFGTKDQPVVVRPSNENQLYWKTGVITFHKDSLGKVFQTLQEEFKQPIVVRNPDILKCNITATFKKQSLETIIRVIKTTHDLETTTEDGKIIIDGEGCH